MAEDPRALSAKIAAAAGLAVLLTLTGCGSKTEAPSHPKHSTIDVTTDRDMEDIDDDTAPGSVVADDDAKEGEDEKTDADAGPATDTGSGGSGGADTAQKTQDADEPEDQ